MRHTSLRLKGEGFRTINVSLLCSVTSGSVNCHVTSPFSWRSCRDQLGEMVCQQVSPARFVRDPETERLPVTMPLRDPFITSLHCADPGKGSVAKPSFSVAEYLFSWISNLRLRCKTGLCSPIGPLG